MPHPNRRLTTPFALPPGRRSLWARFAPEWCALGITVIAVIVYFLMRRYPAMILELAFDAHLTPGSPELTLLPPQRILIDHYLAAASLVYGLAGTLLIFVPVAVVASAWAGERSRGTLEPMLLTSTHHSLTVHGRFRVVALPWLRLALYLLPLYFAAPLLAAAIPGSGIREYSFGAAPWSVSWLTWLGGLRGWHVLNQPANSLHGWLLPALRWANDVSSLFFAAAVAYYFSVRTANPKRAAAWSYTAAGLGLIFVLSPDCWWVLSSLGVRLEEGYVDLRLYWLLMMLAVALRAVTSVILLARVASNFDAYVLGEPVEKERPAARRRRP